MIKMHFPTNIKYNGKDYASFVSFNVKDNDVEELKSKGGIVDSVSSDKPKRTADRKEA